MRSKKTWFFVVVIVSIVSLSWAQIYAPAQLKPLTSHVLDYPRSLPAISSNHGIYRSVMTSSSQVSPISLFTHNTLASLLPQVPSINSYHDQIVANQAKYGGYAGGGTGEHSNAVIGSDVEKAGQTAAIIQSNTGASAEVVAAAIAATGLTVPTAIQTQAEAAAANPASIPATAGTGGQSAAYIAQYGNEVGRFGYIYPDGSVAGTFKADDGSLRVLAIGATQDAYAKNVQTVTNQVAKMTDKELLDSVHSTCDTADYSCKQADITKALNLALTNSAIIDPKDQAAIITAQRETYLASTNFQIKINDFLDPTKSLTQIAGCDPAHPGECRDLTAEMYLKGIGVNPSDISKLLADRQTNLENAKIAKERYEQGVAAANAAANKYLNTPNEQLVKEYCGAGMSPDNCERLIQDGGLLKAAGLDETTTKTVVTQKQANTVVAKYRSGILIPTTVFVNKPANGTQTSQTAYQQCQAAATSGKQCVKGDLDQNNNNTYQLVSTNIRSDEAMLLKAACTTLGGGNCNDSITALDSLGAMTGDPAMNAAKIQSDKLAIQQENAAYAKIAGTLKNQGGSVYNNMAAAVSRGDTTWTQAQTALTAQRQDPLTNIVMGWNDITAGRFKRGNDMLLEGYAQNDWGKSFAGGLIQGGDAAAGAVLITAAALPAAGAAITAAGGTLAANSALGVGVAGFFGTGMGVAATTQMTGSATDTCTQAPGSEACKTSIAMAAISGVGTTLGVVNSVITKSVAGTTFWNLSTAERVAKEVQLATSAVGTVTFSAMGIEACKANPQSLDCVSGAAMAIASVGTLGSGLSLINSSNTTLQAIHTTSAGLFAVSACSKLGDLNSDTVGMCAMGLSGLGNIALEKGAAAKAEEAKLAETKLADTKLAEPKIVPEIKTPTTLEKLTAAQAEVVKWDNFIKDNKVSGDPLKQAQESLVAARTELATAQAAHDATTIPIAQPARTSPTTPELIAASLSKLQDGKTEIATRPVIEDGKPTSKTEINVDSIANPTAKAEAQNINSLIREFEAASGFVVEAQQVQALVSPETISQLKAPDGASLKGKTAVVTRILSVAEPRTMILTENATSAKAYVDTAVLSPEGKVFYEGQKTKVVVVDIQNGGFLEVDMNSKSFDSASAKRISTADMRTLLEASVNGGQKIVMVADRPNAVWTRLGGNENMNPSIIEQLMRQNGTTPEGILMKEITQNTNKQGKFLFIADEMSADIYNNLASGAKGKAINQVTDPGLLGGVKSGNEAISLYKESTSTTTHEVLVKARIAELESGVAESAYFQKADNGRSVPIDVNTHAKSMAEIVDLSLSKARTSNNTESVELRAIGERLRDTSTANTALRELDAFISKNSTTESPLLVDLNFRKASIQNDWNQLARIPGTDFAQEGKNIELRKQGATTGERLSTATELLSFYDKGTQMLDAYKSKMLGGENVNTSILPKLADITVAPPGTQMTVRDFYAEIMASGQRVKGLDATPQEAINALNLGDRPIEAPIKPKTLTVADSSIALATQMEAKREAGKASAVIISTTNPNVDGDILAITKARTGTETVIVAKNRQSPDGITIEEFVEYKVNADGSLTKSDRPPITDSKAWNDRILELSKTSPEKLLLILNVERGLDMTTTLTVTGRVQWSELYDATGPNKPTSVTAEQNWRRDRTFQENHDVYLATEKTGLTVDNVWKDFFVDNLNTKLAEARFQDTIQALGKAAEKGLTNLNTLSSSDLNLNWFERIQFNNLKTELARQASSFESMLNSAVSRDSLTGQALREELYSRAESTNGKLLGMANEIGTRLRLNETELTTVKSKLGATDNFISKDAYLAKLAEPTKQLSSPKTSSPNDILLAYAENNSTAPSADPRFKAIEEQHLASSNTSTPRIAPAVTTPITNSQQSPNLLSRVASTITGWFKPATPTVTSQATPLTPTTRGQLTSSISLINTGLNLMRPLTTTSTQAQQAFTQAQVHLDAVQNQYNRELYEVGTVSPSTVSELDSSRAARDQKMQDLSTPPSLTTVLANPLQSAASIGTQLVNILTPNSPKKTYSRKQIISAVAELRHLLNLARQDDYIFSKDVVALIEKYLKPEILNGEYKNLDINSKIDYLDKYADIDEISNTIESIDVFGKLNDTENEIAVIKEDPSNYPELATKIPGIISVNQTLYIDGVVLYTVEFQGKEYVIHNKRTKLTADVIKGRLAQISFAIPDALVISLGKSSVYILVEKIDGIYADNHKNEQNVIDIVTQLGKVGFIADFVPLGTINMTNFIVNGSGKVFYVDQDVIDYVVSSETFEETPTSKQELIGAIATFKNINNSEHGLSSTSTAPLPITKSVQQAAWDALTGKTVGIVAAPDIVEIGKNFAQMGHNVRNQIRSNVVLKSPKSETPGSNYINNRVTDLQDAKLLRDQYVVIEPIIKSVDSTNSNIGLLDKLELIKRSNEYASITKNLNSIDLSYQFEQSILSDLQANNPQLLLHDELLLTKDDILESSLLIDHTYFVQEMLKGQEDPRYIFGKSAYENWIKARNLTKSKPNEPLTMNLITQANSIINNQHNTGLRTTPIIGGDYVKLGTATTLSEQQVKAISSNKYLRWHVTGDTNKYPQKGFIVYPTIDSFASPDGKTNIRYFDDASIFEMLSAKSYEMFTSEGRTNASLVKALLNDLIIWTNEELSKENVDFIALAAEFQYRFISIHPYNDGNGRTSRLFMNKILQDNNLPASILYHPENDYFYTLREWVNEVRKGTETYEGVVESLKQIDFAAQPTLKNVVSQIKTAIFGKNWSVEIVTPKYGPITELSFEKIDDTTSIAIVSTEGYSFMGKKMPSLTKVVRHSYKNNTRFDYELLTMDGFDITDNIFNRFFAIIGKKFSNSTTRTRFNNVSIRYREIKNVNTGSTEEFVDYVNQLETILSSQNITHPKLEHSTYEAVLSNIRKLSLYDVQGTKNSLRSSKSRMSLFNDYSAAAYTQIQKYLSHQVLYRGAQLSEKTSPTDLVKYFSSVTPETVSYRTLSDSNGTSNNSVVKTMQDVNFINQFTLSRSIMNSIKERLYSQEITVAKERHTRIDNRLQTYTRIMNGGNYLGYQSENHLGIGFNRKDQNYLVSPFLSTARGIPQASAYATTKNQYTKTRLLFEFYQPTEGYRIMSGQTMLVGGIDPKSIKTVYLLSDDGIPKATARLSIEADGTPIVRIEEYEMPNPEQIKEVKKNLYSTRGNITEYYISNIGEMPITKSESYPVRNINPTTSR